MTLGPLSSTLWFRGHRRWVFVSPVQIVTEGHSLKMWMAFFTIAIFQTLIPFGLYFNGIDRIRATRASITSAWKS